jgi:hypothetical protein
MSINATALTKHVLKYLLIPSFSSWQVLTPFQVLSVKRVSSLYLVTANDYTLYVVLLNQLLSLFGRYEAVLNTIVDIFLWKSFWCQLLVLFGWVRGHPEQEILIGCPWQCLWLSSWEAWTRQFLLRLWLGSGHLCVLLWRARGHHPHHHGHLWLIIAWLFLLRNSRNELAGPPLAVEVGGWAADSEGC